MAKDAVIGLQYGDEGKSKVIDVLLTPRMINSRTYHPGYEIVVRYQGGRNAGHTQWFGNKKVVLHIVPSGITHSGVYNAVLSGCFFDPIGALEEVRELKEAGYPVNPDNFGISGRTHVTFPYHIEIDGLMEGLRGKKIGSTKKGISPTAASKAGRSGVRFAEFCGPDWEDILNEMLKIENAIWNTSYDTKRVIEACAEARQFFTDYEFDETHFISENVNNNLLFEGAQAVGLDQDQGSYPFNTASNPSKPPYKTDTNYGVVKAFLTRVGEGPRVTTMDPEIEAQVRGVKDVDPTADFGATTGRPRSCCWFDAVFARHAAIVSETDLLTIMKLDKLDGIDPVKIGVEYELDGGRLSLPPQDRKAYDRCKPVYLEMPGWPEGSSKDARKKNDLHPNAIAFVEALCDQVKRDVAFVSVGPEAKQTIWWED